MPITKSDCRHQYCSWFGHRTPDSRAILDGATFVVMCTRWQADLRHPPTRSLSVLRGMSRRGPCSLAFGGTTHGLDFQHSQAGVASLP